MTSFGIKVRTNAPEIRKAFGHLARSQMPFAIAAGLTDTAREARDDFKKTMPNRFTVRSRRVLSTATFVPASKKDFPDSKAIVGVRDKWIARHEKGGRQRSDKGARFAIPFSFVAKKRTATGRIPARFKPKKLRDRKNVFVADEEIRRKGTKRNQGRNRFHLLRRHINLRPRLGFLATVSKTHRQRFNPNMQKRLRTAIRDTEARFRR